MSNIPEKGDLYLDKNDQAAAETLRALDRILLESIVDRRANIKSVPADQQSGSPVEWRDWTKDEDDSENEE